MHVLAELTFGRNKHTVRAEQSQRLSKSGLCWCPTVRRIQNVAVSSVLKGASTHRI
jgi:hypothetical protein